jgi:hypothetical protein
MKIKLIIKNGMGITNRLIPISFLIYSINTYAVEPYPIVGKTFFVVLMSDKTCNEVTFGFDQKFQLQSANSGIVSGTYEYKSGQLTMRTADVPIFKKARFKKFQESDGKLAVVMEDLIEKGVVNIYANQEFCKSANMKLITLQKDSPSKSEIAKKSSTSGWVFKKMKSSHIFERFKTCEKVNTDFQGHIKKESLMWSDRGAVCVVSSFFDDHANIFECKYPKLGDTTRYYFWHESKDKCESRLKSVQETWTKENLD